MDSPETIDRLKQLVVEFCSERDWDRFHSPNNLAVSLSLETAELLEIFRFLDSEESILLTRDAESRAQIGREIADILFLVLRFASLYSYDLSELLESKIRENANKYPVERFRGSKRKYK